MVRSAKKNSIFLLFAIEMAVLNVFWQKKGLDLLRVNSQILEILIMSYQTLQEEGVLHYKRKGCFKYSPSNIVF